MGIFSFLSDLIRSNNVNNTNRSRRGLTYYKPSHISGFVGADGFKYNIICSGGSPELRSEMITFLCIAATNSNIPVVILHQGDTALNNLLRNEYAGHSALVEIGNNNSYFDPFFQLSSSMVSKLIVDTAPKKYSMTSDAEAFIDVITSLITCRGRKICLHDLASCPSGKITQAINNIANRYALAPAKVTEMQSNLAQGQPESRKVMSYLKELYVECAQLLPRSSSDYTKCVSLADVINNHMVMSFDIISEQNLLLLRLIAEQLQLFIKSRKSFYLILDDIPITENNSLDKLCNGRTAGMKCTVSGDDVFSLCNGDEKMFGALIGTSKKWFVFQHSSGISAEKWSAAFTKYKKIGVTTNHSRHKGGGFGIGLPLFGKPFLNWNNNSGSQQGVAYKDEDEAIIRAEEITKLPNRGGFIYTSVPREIAYVNQFLPY